MHFLLCCRSLPLYMLSPASTNQVVALSAGLSEDATPPCALQGWHPCTLLFLQCTPLLPHSRNRRLRTDPRLVCVSRRTGACQQSLICIDSHPDAFVCALQAWRLLAVFLGTIVGIITQPLPLGAVAMLGLGAAMLTKTLTFAAAFSAFASEIP